ncbi:MAG: hypothetical protein GXW96_09490 [Christensenellaceae bacterium]|nr:hypothetical protein [Christensenellaceae bacterium]
MKQITLNAKDYNDIMKAMKPAVGKDQYRPGLTGVYLEVEGDIARFTACNGCIMTHVVLPHGGDKAEEPWSVIMPVMPIKALPKALVTITVDGDQVTVKNEFTGESISQKAIGGEYVKYRNVIPTPVREHCIYLDARLLRSALEGANLCDQSLVRLSFDLDSKISAVTLKGHNENLFYTGIVLPVKPGHEYFEHKI